MHLIDPVRSARMKGKLCETVTGKETTAKLKAKLDKVFSRFIRLRDCCGSDQGPCCTCGKIVIWKYGDAGHFQTRGRLNTRFDERNVNLQCKYCNGPMSGQQYLHGIFIDHRHGVGTADELLYLSRQSRKITRVEYVDLIEHYNARVKELSEQASLG
jgi:hypothetical protein